MWCGVQFAQRVVTAKASLATVLQFSVAVISALGLGLRLIALSRY
jgi:hypothetical protein